ncbi:MAG: TonB-dependent receptor [Cyclobacteriaceae bacterium]
MFAVTAHGQSQVVKGVIVDAVAEYPLIGATIKLVNTNPPVGSITGIDGSFKISDVPVGRQTFEVTYVGYKSMTLPNVLVSAGKEVMLNLKLEESVESLQSVVITADADKDIPINELAKVSARTFSLEEVTRYSGGRNDVARMAASFAGVSAPDDSRNDIVVRGNSPTGLLWRIEGIPVATTNHFATLGTTGGPVSALNTNLLRTSDFMTGAFPAEYGNANAAVFDVNFRNGNTDKFEFTGQLAAFSGLELMAEGPISKKNNSSFVISFRQGIANVANPGTSADPFYKDLTYKFNFGQSKFGQFELFGMGGNSSINFFGDQISEDDLFANSDEDSFVKNWLGVTGLSHKYSFGKKSYLKTAIAVASINNEFFQDNYVRDADGNLLEKYRAVNVKNLDNRYTFTSNLNTKFSSRWSMRSGVLLEMYDANFSTESREELLALPDLNGDSIPDFFIPIVDSQERYFLTQLFSQVAYKFSDNLNTTFGLHSQHLSVNNKVSLEPRWALSWQFSPLQRASLAYGMHAQTIPTPILFYREETSPGLFETTNLDLGFMNAHHFVLGYDYNLRPNWRLKTEVYYQRITDVPVEQSSSTYSILNEGSDFVFNSKGSLVNEGIGTNYGLEVTLEKFFSNGYYGLLTTSIYESTYKGSDDIQRSTAFNNRYVFNALAGKEWQFGKDNRNAWTFDTKITSAGGKPYTPIDLETSQTMNEEVRFWDQAFSMRQSDYFRWDVKFGYRINSKKRNISQQFFVDLQNVTNRQNEFTRRYNTLTNEINSVKQIGFFPDILYRIQF